MPWDADFVALLITIAVDALCFAFLFGAVYYFSQKSVADVGDPVSSTESRDAVELEEHLLDKAPTASADRRKSAETDAVSSAPLPDHASPPPAGTRRLLVFPLPDARAARCHMFFGL